MSLDTSVATTTDQRHARLNRIELVERAGPFLLLVALCVAGAFLSPAFLHSTNVTNVLRSATPLAVVAAGQTLVILIGGIDVSVGALVAATTVTGGTIMSGSDSKILPTILILLLLGLIVGLVHTVLTVKMGTDPFVTTLGTMLVLQGGTLLYSNGSPQNRVTPLFRGLTQHEVFRIPMIVPLVALLYIVLAVALKRTTWGDRLYAVGGNRSAARLSGVRVDRVQASAWILCSMLTVVGGVILLAFTGSGAPTDGSDLALNSIASVLIGGTAFGGGRGGIAGTAAGVLILTVLFNIFNLLAITTFAQPIIEGVVVIVGIALYSRRRH